MSTRVPRVLAVGAFAVGTDANIVAGILPAVAVGLSTSVATAGLLVSAFSLTYAVAAPLLPLLLGRVPRRVLLTLALLAFVLTNALAALAPTLGVLMVSRVLAAVAAAAYMPTASAVAAGMVSDSARGRALGTVMAGMTAAQVLGVPFGALVGNTAGWRLSFGLVAVLGAAAAVAVGLLLPAVAAPEPGSAEGGLRLRLAASPLIWPVLVQTALVTTAGFATLTYIAPVAQAAAGLRSSAISVVLAGFGVASVVGSTIGGRLSDRVGGTSVAIAGAGGLTLALSGLAATAQASAGTPLLLLFVALWGVSGWLCIPAQQHRLLAAAPADATVLMGLNSSAIYFGAAAGGAAGAVGQSFSQEGNVWLAAAVAAGGLAFLVAVASAPRGQRPFRVRIDPADDGAERVNALGDKVRTEFYRRIELADLLTATAGPRLQPGSLHQSRTTDWC